MNIIYLLIPLALIIAALLIWLFIWAIKTNQFDDLEGPAYKILMDDDKIETEKTTPENNKQNDASLKQSSAHTKPEPSPEQPSEQSPDKNSD